MPAKIAVTKLNFMSQLTQKDIDDLKLKTAAWIQSSGWTPGSKKQIHEIPWELVIVPDYQESRADKSENNKSISNIVANFEDERLMPGLINLRIDGLYAGCFILTDGYHRSRSTEILGISKGFTGFPAIIINTTKDKETIIFATQDMGKQKIESYVEYEALLACNDDSNIRVAAAHLVENTLNKLHITYALRGREKNDGEILAPITECVTIAEKGLKNNDKNKIVWILNILQKSHFIETPNGFNRSMLRVMEAVYNETLKGRFGNITPNDISKLLIKKLKMYTWGSLVDAGQYAMDLSVKQAGSCYSSTKAKSLIRYWICDEFGLDTSEWKKDIA